MYKIGNLCGVAYKWISSCFWAQEAAIETIHVEKEHFISLEQSNDEHFPQLQRDDNKAMEASLISVRRQRENLSLQTREGNHLLREEQGLRFAESDLMQDHTGETEDTEDTDYSDVLSLEHAYYNVLQPKMMLLPTVFRIPQSATKNTPDTVYPLQIYFWIPPGSQIGVFSYFFTFPCDFETYDAMSNDFALQKQLDSKVDQFYKLMQSPENDTKLIYLCYKKVLIISPRDFVYVRYSFTRNNEHWSVSTSVPSEQKKDKIRGEMLLVATRVLQTKEGIEVSISSQVDMKTNLKADMVKNRGFTEIRKYLDKIHNHLQAYGSKSII